MAAVQSVWKAYIGSMKFGCDTADDHIITFSLKRSWETSDGRMKSVDQYTGQEILNQPAVELWPDSHLDKVDVVDPRLL